MVTLLISYLAALGAITRGATPLDLNVLYDEDTTRTWLFFRDLFLLDTISVDGWGLGNSLYIIDYCVMFLIYFLLLLAGNSHAAAILGAPMLAALVFALLSAYGWRAVAQRLYGKDSLIPSVAILLHALPFTLMAIGLADYFLVWFLPVYHYSTWVVVPWLLSLTLNAFGKRGCTPLTLVCLALLTAITMAGDLLILIWFVLPAIGALGMVMWRPYRLPLRRAWRICTALVVGAGLGVLLDNLLPFHEVQRYSLGLKEPWEHFKRMGGLLWRLLQREPLLTMIVVAFTAWVFRNLFRSLLSAWHWHADEDSTDHKVPAVTATMKGFMLYFLPAAIFMCVAAAILSGNVEEYKPHWEKYVGRELRYILPAIYLPLFVGWLFMPQPRMLRKLRVSRLSATAAGFMTAISCTTIVYGGLLLRNLDLFETDFSTCFATLAREHGWQAGMGSIRFMPLIINPELEVERYLPLGVVYKHEPGESAIYLDWTTGNRNWFKGKFDFVIVNAHQDRAHFHPPYHDWQEDCDFLQLHECAPALMRGFLVSTDMAIQGFGQPAAAYECSGVAFLHYDPPLVYDHSGPGNKLGTAVVLGL